MLCVRICKKIGPCFTNLECFIQVSFAEVESVAHIALNRKAAQEGMCLYKNANNILPLNLNSFSRNNSMAVIGILAPDGENLQGNYAMPTDIGAVSILDGIKLALNTSGYMNSVVWSTGCTTIGCPDDTGFASAVAIASMADVAVAVFGTHHDCLDPVACEV